MSSRVIIPEIIDEGSEDRSRVGGADRFPFGVRRQPPALGVGSMLRALAAGLMLVAGVTVAMFLGGIVLLVLGGLFFFAWLFARLGWKSRRGGPTVVVRSMRSDGPMGSTILIERSIQSGHRPSDRGPGE